MILFKLLLFPFAILYDLAARIRNHLYDIGHNRSFSFGVPVIAVGNLNVGGSGKTPMTEYLVQLLKERMRVVTLSRGYKRSTHGFRTADESDTAATLGDEPMQMFRKFGSEIAVTVSEDRAFAIPNILQHRPETGVILLDDALQHRSVRPALSILLTDRTKPFYEDHVLPYGRLRESRSGATRSDIIVVTKCEEKMSAESMKLARERIRIYAGDKPVFFSTISYGKPRWIAGPDQGIDKVVLVTGIASSRHFEKFCSTHFRVLHHFKFRDHHQYTPTDIAAIHAFCKKEEGPVSVIMTEKDSVKLASDPLKELPDSLSWFYVPIQHVFVEDGLKFDNLVINAVAGDPSAL